MRKQLGIALAVMMMLTLCWTGAMAADVFQFDNRSIELFEGDTARPALLREGAPAEEGKVTYTSTDKRAVSVTENGTNGLMLSPLMV